MFEDKTVLILGAGASRPYGFPTSGQLRQLILGGDGAINALGELQFNVPHQHGADLERALKNCAPSPEMPLPKFRQIFRRSR